MNKSKEAYERAVFVVSTIGGTGHDVDLITGYVIELEARIAELEKENEILERGYNNSFAKYDALQSRIDNAPKAWLTWDDYIFGNVMLCESELAGPEKNTCVRLVTVDEEEANE